MLPGYSSLYKSSILFDWQMGVGVTPQMESAVVHLLGKIVHSSDEKNIWSGGHGPKFRADTLFVHPTVLFILLTTKPIASFCGRGSK